VSIFKSFGIPSVAGATSRRAKPLPPCPAEEHPDGTLGPDAEKKRAQILQASQNRRKQELALPNIAALKKTHAGNNGGN
jgi:hypothetical protein